MQNNKAEARLQCKITGTAQQSWCSFYTSLIDEKISHFGRKQMCKMLQRGCLLATWFSCSLGWEIWSNDHFLIKFNLRAKHDLLKESKTEHITCKKQFSATLYPGYLLLGSNGFFLPQTSTTLHHYNVLTQNRK